MKFSTFVIMIFTQAIRRQVTDLRDAPEVRRSGLFMVQGEKAIRDTLGHFRLCYLLATNEWLEAHPHLDIAETCSVPAREMARMTTLKSPPEVIAVYELPQPQLDEVDLTQQLVVALDCVQDPGNVGTIMRVADWMGVRHILCSRDTAFAYTPKVIQATMGAISRVQMHYVDLADVLGQMSPIYGTFMEGENIYEAALMATGVLLMGSEGHGIRPELASLVTQRLTIPAYPAGAQTSESLNVAMATGICLSEFRRRMYHG